MDLLVLDENLDVVQIIDTYQSLIWTDRYQEAGDFELCMSMTPGLFDTIKQDRYLQSRHSDHVMIIEKIAISSDDENGDQVTISGQSLESLLNRRIVWGLKILNGNLQEGLQTIFNENIINPSNTNRKIENFIFESSTDSAITNLTIDTQYTGDNIYDIVTTICIEQGLGFKVTLSENKQFVFKMYKGIDRSYSQDSNPYVIFSPNFENLITSNYIESKAALKNVTLVGGEGEGAARRYTAVGNIEGLNRREIFTDARDISSEIDEDITEQFDFTMFPGQVYSYAQNNYISSSLFNSCRISVIDYIGRTISITIPRCTTTTGIASNFATILTDTNGKFISILKKWEKYDGEESNRGSLETYEIFIPEGAACIYTSMFSERAIETGVYNGDTDDFECASIKLSNSEYIALLRQRGKETLSENIEITSFEGEAEATIMFKYGVDFFNGDIVQVSDEYGHETRARVLEVVASVDEEGTSIYPTFISVTEEGV